MSGGEIDRIGIRASDCYRDGEILETDYVLVYSNGREFVSTSLRDLAHEILKTGSGITEIENCPETTRVKLNQDIQGIAFLKRPLHESELAELASKISAEPGTRR